MVFYTLFTCDMMNQFHLSPHGWEIVETKLRYSRNVTPCCRNLFLHISRATPSRLRLNCVSTILDNRATVHLMAEMKNICSFQWRLETVRRTLETKSGDVATTSDQWRLALSRPVAQQS